MSVIDDGGPAFPNKDELGNMILGMTLRDWFAGQALVGLLGTDPKKSHFWDDPNGRTIDDWLAMNSFDIADAMLAARKGDSSVPALDQTWIQARVYRSSPDHAELLRARFPSISGVTLQPDTFEFQGHRWRYLHDSFDDAGEYTVIERPNEKGGAA